MQKAQIVDEIWERVAALQEERNFNPIDGWNQVEDESPEVIMDYGAWHALRELLSVIEGS